MNKRSYKSALALLKKYLDRLENPPPAAFCRLQILFVGAFVKGDVFANTRQGIKGWAGHFVLSLISLMTMIRVRYRSDITLGHMLIDISHRGEDYDFRSAPFLELAPPKTTANFFHFYDMSHTLRTCLRKSNPVYFESIHYFWLLFRDKKSRISLTGKFLDLPPEEAAAFGGILATHELWTNASESKIDMIRFLIRFMRLEKLLAIDDPRHFNEAKLACRAEGLPTVAYMHARFNRYDVGQFQFPPDTYLVWSEYFKESFIRLRPASSDGDVVVTGHPRLTALPRPVMRNTDPVTVVFVGESSAPDEEVFPYIDALVAEKNIRVLFRPKSDTQRDALSARLGTLTLEIARPLPFLDLLREETVCVIVATYSTTLMESWLVGVPSILAKTSNDYAMNMAEEGNAILCSSPDEIVSVVEDAAVMDAADVSSVRDRIWGFTPGFDPHNAKRFF